MRAKRFLFLGASVIASCLFWASRSGSAQPTQATVVRIAELEIDPAQLPAYTVALKEEIEASIRLEPGVITLLAVAVKDHPNQVRLFKTYRDADAYRAHLQTAHFKKYKTETARMVTSFTLIETDPILLGSKSK